MTLAEAAREIERRFHGQRCDPDRWLFRRIAGGDADWLAGGPPGKLPPEALAETEPVNGGKNGNWTI